MNTEKAVCERFGVPSYRIVVPDRDQPALIAFELREGVMSRLPISPGMSRSARPGPSG